jgi:hypothetical protein
MESADDGVRSTVIDANIRESMNATAGVHTSDYQSFVKRIYAPA